MYIGKASSNTISQSSTEPLEAVFNEILVAYKRGCTFEEICLRVAAQSGAVEYVEYAG